MSFQKCPEQGACTTLVVLHRCRVLMYTASVWVKPMFRGARDTLLTNSIIEIQQDDGSGGLGQGREHLVNPCSETRASAQVPSQIASSSGARWIIQYTSSPIKIARCSSDCKPSSLQRARGMPSGDDVLLFDSPSKQQAAATAPVAVGRGDIASRDPEASIQHFSFDLELTFSLLCAWQAYDVEICSFISDV